MSDLAVEAARETLRRAGSDVWRSTGPQAHRFMIATWQVEALVIDLMAQGHPREAANAAVRLEFEIYGADS